VAAAGGLSIEEATLLLAVQDLVRDEVSGALEKLRPPQAEWFGRWRDVLEEHEDELRALLRIDEDAPPRAALVRAPAPRVPAHADEPDLRRFNEGQITFRVPYTNRGLIALSIFGGVLVSAVCFAVCKKIIDTLGDPEGDRVRSVLPPSVIGIALGGFTLVGGWIGWRLSRSWMSTKYNFMCTDPVCGAYMAGELPTCPGCGGTIAETLAHANLRLARLEELRGGDEPEPPRER